MVTFMCRIFTYNILKPFSYGQEYFKKHFPECSQDSNNIDSKNFSNYAQLVKYGSLRFGIAGIISANIALSAFGILLLITADLFLARVQVLWLRVLLNLFCFAFCIYKFDVFPFKSELNYLKFLFALYSLVSRIIWLLVYLLFIAFENITLM